ncbi:hypothetical protein G9A89_002101 [Geosiphon pyriformis]|nr:hypothetical protein G9A89_002101 [Geosiphon pyriformis]
MKTFLQILGCATPDTTPSVLLHFDTKAPRRYLFNCGEATQRICLENHLRLTRLQNIFATRIDWETMGGLPGFLLSMADSGVAKAKVYGGENLTHFIVATRSFIVRSSMSLETHEFPEDGTQFQDENLTIKTVILHPNSNIIQSQIDATSESFNSGKISLPLKRAFDSDLQQAEQQSNLEYKKKLLGLMFNQSQRQNSDQKPSKRRNREEETVFEIPVDDVEGSNKKNNIFLSSVSSNRSIADKRREFFPKRLPQSEPSNVAITYICQGPDYKGKFYPERATALGLQPGPLYAKLHQGQSVTGPDGTTVHPHQVMGDPRPGFILIIIDVPSVNYIESVCSNTEFAAYQNDNENSRVGLIVHMLGNGVLDDERYRTWMRKYGSDTQHIISNEQYCLQRLIFNKAGQSQFKLSKLDETQFRVPFYSNEPLKNLKSVENLPEKVTLSAPLLIYHMEPKPKLDDSQVPTLFDHRDPQSYVVKSLNKLQDYLKVATQLKENLKETSQLLQSSPGHDIIVTTLGTGSGQPSKYRNVSSNLITIPNYGSILLDAGEGTYGQLVRQFGPIDGLGQDNGMNLRQCIKGLRCIFISHLHADHHLGTIRILRKWSELNKDNRSKLFIVAPGRFFRWLDEYNDVEFFGISNLLFIDNRDILENSHFKNDRVSSLKNQLGLKKITSVEVIHCPSAFGISLEHKDGWKIVYSGDTRPCDNLVRVGKDATLLIHEATFENDLQEDAIMKRHCTTKEAVQISQRMNAKSTLFTHFSQRYPKVPIFTDAHDRIGIGFDLMQVRLGQFYKLPKYVEALKVLYGDECEEANESDESAMLFAGK